MKVSDIGAARGTSSAKKAKTKGARGSDFSVHLQEATEAAEGGGEVSDTAPVSSVDAILSVQEVPDALKDTQRRAIMEWGEDVLDKLEEIRRDILLGRISKERLVTLAQGLRARKARIDDPALKAIIEDIELRAEVEIAKFSRGF